MTRIAPLHPGAAPAEVRQLLDGVHQALSRGVLERKFREQIALAVAQSNACEYRLSAHSALGKAARLDASARNGTAADKKVEAGLKCAQELVRQRGHIADEALNAVRCTGYTDAGIGEIIAHVALNIFTNYFVVSQPEVDFPRVTVAQA